MNDDKCGDCRFFGPEPTQYQAGSKCRRYPKRWVDKEGWLWAYAGKGDEACGEFKRADAEILKLGDWLPGMEAIARDAYRLGFNAAHKTAKDDEACGEFKRAASKVTEPDCPVCMPDGRDWVTCSNAEYESRVDGERAWWFSRGNVWVGGDLPRSHADIAAGRPSTLRRTTVMLRPSR